jgi:glutathione S-transferase
MSDLTLVFGNKNYSSWSMRPWVLLSHFDIPFKERLVKFETKDWDDNIASLSPSKLVPVLWEGEVGKGFATWDTLAIAERVAELFPDKAVWPRDPRARARARSVASEMHAGFRALRGAMPMNLRSSHPGKGHTPEALADAARVHTIWRECLQQSGGPFLFGQFSAADAMYAPVVTRFITYGLKLDADLQKYSDAVMNAKGVAEWVAAGRKETEFVTFDEPYADPPK